MNTLLEIADYTSTNRPLTSSLKFNELASSASSTKKSKARRTATSAKSPCARRCYRSRSPPHDAPFPVAQTLRPRACWHRS
jgi:hypothetical protein